MNFSTDYDNFFANVSTSSDAKKFDNSTFDDDLSRKNLKFIFDIQTLLSVLIVMLAMGTDIAWDDLWYHIKRPIGMSIGLVSQFILMPLSAFALLLVSGVVGVHATGVLIIACCPGGPLSNMFTYLSGGDLPLR
ncbi:hypothetical protein JTE90_027781 [Oedothorax gibbosus]|uniref:Uncharacterized protein n=1 Tax=Oedothorax gibbosus TaxID=931172 RepID=A0AAV6V7F0_9ARAC|nr:hypothetical protein JTE90_027781 [Oedothorax gibbosus]